MRSKTAIIGQSNAILSNGFVHHLAQTEGIEIGNMGRLGASPSILLPYFASRSFFAGHAFAIFDLAISDQGFLWSQAIDPYLIVQWLEYGIVQAHAAGCIPILLVIPHQAVISSEPDGPIPLLQQLYRSVALRNGALCFDLYDEVKRRGLGDPAALNAVYADPDHLSTGFAAEVSATIARRMQAVSESSIERFPAFAAVPAFDRLQLPTVPNTVNTMLVSSLLSGNFVTLSEGDSLSVPIGTADRIEGVLVDRAGSGGKLQIAGSETVVKAVGTPPDSSHSFVAQILPLLGSVADRHGVVEVSAVSAGTAATEPSWQSVNTVSSEVRIAELIVQRRPSALSFMRPVFPPHLRTTDWI